jgi:hypothetical protein
MGAKLVIALAAVCIAVILVSTVFIGLFFSANIGKIENSIQTQTNPVNNQQTPLLVPIIQKPGLNATAIVLSLTAEDNRILSTV